MQLDAYRRVTDCWPEPTLLVTTDGQLVAANGSAVARLAGTDARLEGRNLLEFTRGDHTALLEFLRACSRSRQLQLGAAEFDSRGTAFDARLEGAVFQPRAGDAPALVMLRMWEREVASARFLDLNLRLDALTLEIEHRRQTEEKLRQQREWLHVTLTSIADGVIAIDAACRVIFMNPVAEMLTGWTERDATGMPVEAVFQLVEEDSGNPVPNPAAEVIRSDPAAKPSSRFAVLIGRTGERRTVDPGAARMTMPDGTLLGAVVTFRDVSDLRRLETELRQRATKLSELATRKDEFIAMLAHELRNPLAPIQNGVYLLQMQKGNAEVVDVVRGTIDRQVRHMTRLIDDLLDVSRLSRGRITLKESPGDLARLVLQVCAEFQAVLDAAGVELAIEVPSDPVEITGDWTRLRQIITNLLDNAAKFTEPGGRVSVQLGISADRRHATLSVTDTGIGIEPELLARLFEPFSQGSQSLDRGKGGLGLGLAVVKGLVQLHSGSIHVSSEGRGRGTRCVVGLPIDLPTPVQVTNANRHAPHPARSIRILVVEDNFDSAETLRLMLVTLGHEVSVAHTGDEAIRTACSHRPQLVLCDLGLPGMDGYAVAGALRAAPLTRDVRLVALTGYGQDQDKQRALAAGFDEHLTKPLQLERLVGELNRFMH